MFEARYIEVLPKQTPWQKGTRFSRPRRFLQAEDLDVAVRGSDKYATDVVLKGTGNLGFG